MRVLFFSFLKLIGDEEVTMQISFLFCNPQDFLFVAADF